jgi:hypothetical protein
MTPAHDTSPTDREAAVLGPLAEHRFLIVPQVATLLGVGERAALARLKQLEKSRLTHFHSIFVGLPWAASIQGRGLRALGSTLKAPPRLNFNEYRHDVGVGWMWLAARAGSFGDLRGITTDRRMQADDLAARAAGIAPPWGVGLGMLNSHGRPQLHYPDLMLDTASGHRVAVELELTAKSAGRMNRIMNAYASDARVDEVLYVTANRSIAARVRDSARRAGIPERVHVQLLAADGIAGAEIGRIRTAVRARTTTRERASAER